MRGLGRKSTASVSARFHVKRVLLTAPPKHASPEADRVEPEGPQCRKIRWHCVIGEKAGYDLPRPFPPRDAGGAELRRPIRVRRPAFLAGVRSCAAPPAVSCGRRAAVCGRGPPNVRNSGTFFSPMATKDRGHRTNTITAGCLNTRLNRC